MKDAAIREARAVGIAAAAGAIAGAFVAGVGGRLAMRLIALQSGPGAQGASTANGNIVGLITLEGTVALILFAGAGLGVSGGLVYHATHLWLHGTGRWRPLVFGVLLLLALGFTVLDPANPDFRSFGNATENVLLFAAVFVAFGALLARLAVTLDRVTPGAPGIPRRGYLGNILAVVVAGSFAVAMLLLASIVATTALLVAGATDQTGFGLTASLVLLGILAAGAIGRLLGQPWRHAVMALPLLAGAALTVRSVVALLGLGA